MNTWINNFHSLAFKKLLIHKVHLGRAWKGLRHVLIKQLKVCYYENILNVRIWILKHRYIYSHPTTLCKTVTYIPFNEGKNRDKIIFLEILGTVESSLCQLAALIRYFLPVRLTHHKADSALSICILLLFKIGPSNLDKKENVEGVMLWPGNGWIEIFTLIVFWLPRWQTNIFEDDQRRPTLQRSTSIYPFLSWFGHACGIVVRQLKVVLQACQVFTFPLPTAPQTIQLVCMNGRLLFRSARPSHKNFNFTVLTFIYPRKVNQYDLF